LIDDAADDDDPTEELQLAQGSEVHDVAELEQQLRTERAIELDVLLRDYLAEDLADNDR